MNSIYTTYINFEDMRWVETYWHKDEMVGMTEWEFHSTIWNNKVRNGNSNNLDYETTGYPLSTIMVMDEETIRQDVTMPIGGKNYMFVSTYTYDGAKFSATITFMGKHTDESMGCSKTWDSPAGEVWMKCDKTTDFPYDVYTMITTSFDSEYNFEISASQVRAQYWIDYEDTYFNTYINFESLQWVETYWKSGIMRWTSAAWDFH